MRASLGARAHEGLAGGAQLMASLGGTRRKASLGAHAHVGLAGGMCLMASLGGACLMARGPNESVGVWGSKCVLCVFYGHGILSIHKGHTSWLTK